MRRLAKRIIRGSFLRLRWFIIPVANLVLPYLPARAILDIAYLSQALHLPGQHNLLARLISSVAAQQNDKSALESLLEKKKWDAGRFLAYLTCIRQASRCGWSYWRAEAGRSEKRHELAGGANVVRAR